MTFRKLPAATTALLLGLAGAVAIASPAAAASADIVTPDWVWNTVNDNRPYIEDTQSYYPDFMGTGVEMSGWTSDSLDGYIYDATLLWDGTEYGVTFAPVSADYVDNGLSTIVVEGTVNVDGSPITLTTTLAIEGGTARWTFDFAGDADILAASDLRVRGGLGSDSGSTYTTVGTHGLVSHDTDGYDPILGWDTNGTDLVIDAVDGNDDLAFTFSAVSATTLTLGMVEYDICSRDVAIAHMTAAVPTLASQFGTTFPSQYSDACATVVTPAATPGAVNIDLPITSSAALDGWGYFDPSGESGLGVVATGLPAGMALTVDYVGTVPTLHLTGTAPAGAYNFTAWVYHSTRGEGGGSSYPLQITIAFGTALAATGSEPPMSVIIGGSVLGLLGVTLVLVAARRRLRANA